MALGQLAITPKRASASVGDDLSLGFTLWDNGAVKDVSGGTIKAAIQSLAGHTTVAATAQASGTAGASWSTGVVIVVLPAALMAATRAGEYRLEIQYTSGAGLLTTWPLIPLEIQGTVIA